MKAARILLLVAGLVFATGAASAQTRKPRRPYDVDVGGGDEDTAG
jgi:hypothetical protein